VIIILFGVTGAGKTTIGRKLAAQLSWRFCDADEFHSRANVAKMEKGVPLSDADRGPWLERLRTWIEETSRRGEDAVLACSALKREYRCFLHVNDQVQFIYLRGEYDVIARRLRKRRGHFMHSGLLRSQFAALEEPAAREAMFVDVEKSPAEIVEQIKEKLRL
jgi:gluconokinase